MSQRTCNSRIQKIRTRKERMGTADKPEEAKLTSREGQPTKLTNQRLCSETIGYFPQSQQNTRLQNCRRFCPKQNVSITKKTTNRTRKNFNVTLTPWSKKTEIHCIASSKPSFSRYLLTFREQQNKCYQYQLSTNKPPR